MSKKARNILCGCCCQDSAAVSKDQFPLAKKQTCVSMGIQTESYKCRNYYEQENQSSSQRGYPLENQPSSQRGYPLENQPRSQRGYPLENQQSYQRGYSQENQQSYQRGYPQENQQNYQRGFEHGYQQDYSHDYSQNYQKDYNQECIDPCAETSQYYGNQYDAELGHQLYGAPVGPCHRYNDDASTHQNDPAMASSKNNGKIGYQKEDEMRCRYDPLSSRYNALGGDQNEVTRDGDDHLSGIGGVDDANNGMEDGVGNQIDQDLAHDHEHDHDHDDDETGHKNTPHHHGKKPKGSGPSGLTRTATIMPSNQPPFLNRGPFSSHSRPYSAMPYVRSRNSLHPDTNGRGFGPGRRATDPGNQRQSMMETRNRRRNSSLPFARPPLTTYSIPQASCSENPFYSSPQDHPRDIWQNNNQQSYLFGFGKKKAAKNSGDGSSKLKMLYQINNAGVTCNCGQRMQFNLSVEENEGRCVACFEELRQDFADLLDLYKEMGYTQCECKGRISVTDLANEYLMDQANNASGLGYENVGAPRKKAPVKTIELTPTEGFTGCLCREIKMEMFRKPSDLRSCQCDTDRPKIVLRPPSEDDDDESEAESEKPEHEEEPELLSESESEEPEHEEEPEPEPESEPEIENDPSPASRSDSILKSPTNTSAETVYTVAGSYANALFKKRKPVPPYFRSKQSSSSNTASYETASSDRSVQSNKTYIISN